VIKRSNDFQALLRWCSVVGRSRRETLGASAPKDHFHLIDLIARVVSGRQARRVAHGAVDVDRFSATATDNMVVIVTDPILSLGGKPLASLRDLK